MSRPPKKTVEEMQKESIERQIIELQEGIKTIEKRLSDFNKKKSDELSRLNTVNKPAHNAQKEALEELKGQLNSARKAKLQFRGEEQNRIIEALEKSVLKKEGEVAAEESRIRNMPRMITKVYNVSRIQYLTEELSTKKKELQDLEEEYASRYGERFVSVAEAPAAPPKIGILSWFGLGGRRHRRCKTVRRVRRSKKTARKHSRR
jgi:hypothetical protein